MKEKIEELVLSLKSDSRFKILKDKKLVGFWASGGVSYNEYTELESNNLKILYVKETVMGSELGDEITVTNKIENVYAYCNSPYIKSIFKDKPVKKTNFDIEEIKEYINKNA